MGRTRGKSAQVREHVREQSRAAYREAILVAAEKVFAERGFTGTRMSDVAAEAGLATGTLYNYFDNKDAIFCTLIQERCDWLLQQMKAAGAAALEPLLCIEDMVRTCFAFIEEHRAGYAMMMEMGGMADGGTCQQVGGAELVPYQQAYAALFAEAIASAIDAGRVRDLGTPQELAAFLTGAMGGVARAWITTDAESRLLDKTELVTRLFFSGASIPK